MRIWVVGGKRNELLFRSKNIIESIIKGNFKRKVNYYIKGITNFKN